MAKTAEQKAVAAAAKAEKSQLKSAQKAEVQALKSSGANKSEVKAEKKANTVELKALTQAQKSGTYTPTTNLAAVRSEVGTYGNASYLPQVQGLLNTAAQNYVDYNIPTVTKAGNTTVGIGLDKLVNYELGKTNQKFNKLMNNAQTYVGNTFNAADLAAQGVKLREDKKNPGLYKWSSGGDVTYFTQNPDGSYTGSGINRIRKEDGGGIFDSALGLIALGIGAYYLGPMAGQLAGLSGGLGGAIGGGLLGGAASGLTGSDWRTGLLAGAAGGFAGGGGFSGMLSGTQPAAPVYEAGTGRLISAGEAIPGALTGTGQNLGSFGQLGSAMPFNPADISLTPTIPGAEMQLGTAGFGTALRPAAALATDLAAAGFALGTAANLAGMTAAGTGATNLLGGATSLAPVAAPTLWDKIRGYMPSSTGFNLPLLGASMLPGLLNQPQEVAQDGGGYGGAAPNYNALIAALSAPRVQRSLV